MGPHRDNMASSWPNSGKWTSAWGQQGPKTGQQGPKTGHRGQKPSWPSKISACCLLASNRAVTKNVVFYKGFGLFVPLPGRNMSPTWRPHGPNKPQDDMGPTWPQDGPQHGPSRPSQPSPTAILAWKWVLPEILYSRERLRRILRKKAAVVIHLHTLTFADLHLHTLTSADLHLHTFTSADLHLHTLTSADLHLHTLTSADLHFTPSHLLIYIFTPSHLLNTSSHPHIC